MWRLLMMLRIGALPNADFRGANANSKFFWAALGSKGAAQSLAYVLEHAAIDKRDGYMFKPTADLIPGTLLASPAGFAILMDWQKRTILDAQPGQGAKIRAAQDYLADKKAIAFQLRSPYLDATMETSEGNE